MKSINASKKANFETNPYKVYNKYTFSLKDNGIDYIVGFQEMCPKKVTHYFYKFMLGCGHSEAAIASAMRDLSDEWFDAKQSLINEASQLNPD